MNLTARETKLLEGVARWCAPVPQPCAASYTTVVRDNLSFEGAHAPDSRVSVERGLVGLHIQTSLMIVPFLTNGLYY